MDSLNEDWIQFTNTGDTGERQFLVAIPPSQSEDTWTNSTDFNTTALRNLPGLHPKPEERVRDSEVIEFIMDPKGHLSEDREANVLVMDSEVENKQRTDTASDDVHTVEESVSEDDQRQGVHGVSSGIDADVTVIEKDVGGPSKVPEPYLLSQEDIFKGKDDEEGGVVHATPSHTVPSLHFSGEPMLVPETVEEEDQPVCPSPDAYGDVPVIIPSSPTMTPAEADEILFSPVGTCTLETGRRYQPSAGRSSSQRLVEEGSQRPGQPSVESPLGQGQLAGPTLAGDLWQQSQSLHLRLTESTSSSQPEQQLSQQQGQVVQESQGAGVPAFASQSQADQGCGNSQNLHLYLTPSQPSQSQSRISDEFRSSLPGDMGQQASQATVGETGVEAPKSGTVATSLGGSVDLPVRPVEAETKAHISLDMVQSQTQSASETTFRLERPDTSHLNPGEPVTERGGEMTVFARTRLGTRLIKMAAALTAGEESSVEFLTSKKDELSQGSSSDSIPCSQNRPSKREVAQPEAEGKPAEAAKGDKSAENEDVYGVETVQDSEPEADEDNTQTYNVFPALSRSAEEMAIDDVEVPVLPDTSIASRKPSRPPSQQAGSQSQVTAASSQSAQQKAVEKLSSSQGHGGQSQQTASQQASQHGSSRQSQLAASQESAEHAETETVGSGTRQRRRSNRDSQKKGSDSADRASQEAKGTQRRRNPTGETGGCDQQTRQSQQAPSQEGHSQQLQQGKSQESSAVPAQRASQRRQKGASAAEISLPSVSRTPHSPGPETSKQGEHEEEGKETRVSQSTPSALQQPDPYTFHGSQSQVQEVADNSRAEISVSTLKTSARHEGMATWKRRRLVKKKSEPGAREPEVTSPSTDETTATTELPPKLAKKSKKGTTSFTKLQKFKKPQAPEQRLASKPEKQPVPVPETRPQAEPMATSETSPARNLQVIAGTSSAASAYPPQPVPGTSRQTAATGTAGSSQEARPLGKTRRSVEFADVVQYGLSEQSLSDSQSSDMVLEETQVREMVFRIVQRIITVRKLDSQGRVIEEKTTEEKSDPVMVEENEINKKRRIYNPQSLSRSGSTLTSGDLADISSSSLSHKTSSGPSSLEVDRGSSFGPSAPERSSLEFYGGPSQCLASSGANAKSPGSHTAGAPPAAASQPRRSEASLLVGQTSAASSPGIGTPSLNQSSIAHDESRHEAVVTSSSSGRNSDPLYSTDNLPSNDLPCAQQSNPHRKSSSSSPDVVPPTSESTAHRGVALRSTTRASSRSTKRMAADSSQEGRQDASKGASSTESQFFHPGSESGGFSVHLSTEKRSSNTSSSDSADRTVKPQTETATTVQSSEGSSNGDQMSLQVPVQGALVGDETPVVRTASELVIDAHLMARWKDGCFYPATFKGLNMGIGNKFIVLFEDGVEKTVRGVDLIMAQHLPIGQSVLVSGDDGLSDPGMVIKHIIEGNKVLYDVAMDNGTTRRIPRGKLLLTEDQASCLLSEEELRVSFGEKDGAQINTADVSLDNVILGRRLRTKGSPAVAVPCPRKPSTSTASSDGEREAPSPRKGSTMATRKQSKSGQSGKPGQLDKSGQSGSAQSPSKGKSSKVQEKETQKSSTSSHKRKGGPVATSTPTPKQKRVTVKQETPTKVLSETMSPVGAAVSSPAQQKRPVRKARAGLFENTKGPLPQRDDLFEGYTFILTYIEKLAEVRALEKKQLTDPSLELSSAGESTDDGGLTEDLSAPFDKDHLTMQIEGGGGVVLKKFPQQAASMKNVFVVSDTYQRTVKYLQALAANVPSVSHMWIIDSCLQNKLLDHQAYLLPAGISLEKRKVMERTRVAQLAGYSVLLTSSQSEYLANWRSILELAQCKVVSKWPSNATKNRPGVEVMVTDGDCVPSILEKARKLKIPVVGSEWVIQCLINNEIMAFDGHPNYNHKTELYKQVKGASP